MDSCEACVRLGFKCSLADSSSPVSPLAEQSTAAPRKRGGRACDLCREQKARCVHGDTADCLRCQQLGRLCNYSLSVRQYRAQQHRRRRVSAFSSHSSRATFSEGGISPATENAHSRSSAIPAKMDRYIPRHHFFIDFLTCRSVLGCDKDVARQHIDAFFEFIYPTPIYSFLHRADTLRKYALEILPPVVLLAICGAAARFLSPSKEATDRARSWIDAAESKVFKSLGEVEQHHVEALMILGYNRRCNHQSGKTFFFTSLAARMVYYLRLHKEDQRLPFLEQERRRRLVWCIFAVDRFCAGGVQVCRWLSLSFQGL